jgi:hypothetical protein
MKNLFKITNLQYLNVLTFILIVLKKLDLIDLTWKQVFIPTFILCLLFSLLIFSLFYNKLR